MSPTLELPAVGRLKGWEHHFSPQTGTLLDTSNREVKVTVRASITFRHSWVCLASSSALLPRLASASWAAASVIDVRARFRGPPGHLRRQAALDSERSSPPGVRRPVQKNTHEGLDENSEGELKDQCFRGIHSFFLEELAPVAGLLLTGETGGPGSQWPCGLLDAAQMPPVGQPLPPAKRATEKRHRWSGRGDSWLTSPERNTSPNEQLTELAEAAGAGAAVATARTWTSTLPDATGFVIPNHFVRAFRSCFSMLFFSGLTSTPRSCGGTAEFQRRTPHQKPAP